MKTFILSWPSGREEYHCEQEALDRLLALEVEGETVETCQIIEEEKLIRLDAWPERRLP
jgi:hypothetical protein